MRASQQMTTVLEPEIAGRLRGGGHGSAAAVGRTVVRLRYAQIPLLLVGAKKPMDRGDSTGSIGPDVRLKPPVT